MTDYVQAALNAHRQAKESAAQRDQAEACSRQSLIDQFAAELGPGFSRALAGVLGGDPRSAEFAGLRWQFADEPEVEHRQDGVYLLPGGRSGKWEMITTFQA